MDYNNLEQHFSFALPPVFKVGIYDGINPCGFATALIFVLYLSSVGYTQKRVFWLGLLFIVSSVVAQFGLACGLCDFIVTVPFVMLFLRIFYFLLAAIFLVLGVIHIMDRWQYGKYFNTKRFKCKVPVFFNDSQSEKPAASKTKRFLIIIEITLLTIAIGFFMTLCSSIYPQSEYIFIVHSYYMAGGDARFARLSFFQYSFATALPLAVVWIAILFSGLMKKKTKVILYYKGISAALFLSVGIGLGYFLLTLLF